MFFTKWIEKRRKPYLSWNEKKVLLFFESIGLSQCKSDLEKLGRIDGELLFHHLTEDEIVSSLHLSEKQIISLLEGIFEVKSKGSFKTWTVSNVVDFVTSLQMYDLIAVVRDNAIHGGYLFTMSEEDLRTIVTMSVGKDAQISYDVLELRVKSFIACVNHVRKFKYQPPFPKTIQFSVQDAKKNFSANIVKRLEDCWCCNGIVLSSLNAKDFGFTPIEEKIFKKELKHAKRQYKMRDVCDFQDAANVILVDHPTNNHKQPPPQQEVKKTHKKNASSSSSSVHFEMVVQQDPTARPPSPVKENVKREKSSNSIPSSPKRSNSALVNQPSPKRPPRKDQISYSKKDLQ